ncbi:MAG: diaminopimelate epimerase [Acidimicrobiales bacterium]
MPETTNIAPKRKIALTKHHGLGNDFLITVAPTHPIDAADAVAWCDRRLGIGADGLIVATPIAAPDLSGESGGEGRRWRMVLWNADGGRAEISGNGIRCLGQAIVEHLGLDRREDQLLTIETDAGTRQVIVKAVENHVDDSTQDLASSMVRVGMGKAVAGPDVSDRWSEVGVDVHSQQGVDIGNPHLVAFVDSIADADMATIGPVIEADYPSGLNVHLVEVTGRGSLNLKVWERGAGVTQACGTGACAAAWAAQTMGLVDQQVSVTMPGGAAEVELTDDEVFLIGPAVRVGAVIING